MKKKILLSIILILIMLVSCVYATEEGASIPKEWLRTEPANEETIKEIISSSHMMTDENVSLQDTAIDGNLFAVGTNVSLNNVVIYGNAFIVGQNTTLSNVTIYGTVFVVGETVNINNSNFTGNLFNASQTFNFTGGAQDIFVASENIELNENSLVYRDVFAVANKIILSGSVGRNVSMSAEETIVKSSANINGTLNYSSKQEANIAAESKIGAVNFDKEVLVDTEETTNSNNFIYNVVVLLVKSILVCGFIFLYARGFIEKQKTENVLGYFVKNTFKGLGWLILIPIIATLLLCTGVSVGLSFVVFVVYAIILWLSVPVVAIAITANVTKNQDFKAWKFYGYSLLVSIILILFKQVSIFGGIVTFILALTALGIVMSSLKNKKVKAEQDAVEVIK